MSLIISVPIPDELIPVLEQKARSVGLGREEYVSAVLSRALNAPQSLAEILAPFREQVSTTGISDPELDELFRTARDEAATPGSV